MNKFTLLRFCYNKCVCQKTYLGGKNFGRKE